MEYKEFKKKDLNFIFKEVSIFPVFIGNPKYIKGEFAYIVP